VLGFASYPSALSAEELAAHARALFEGTTAPPAALRISAFSRNPATGQMSLTWTSTVGKRYEINSSTNLASFGQVLATDIPADTGTSTTRTFTAPVAGAGQFYFRVKEL
jgi:hypothetical protein